MKTYQNTFETLGEPLPAQAESAREYARAFLPCFVLDEDSNRYRIDQPKNRLGYAKEVEFWKRLYEATEDKAQYDWDGEDWSGLISEEKLLDFLEEAVEEVR
jgi:hypothetical protein